MSLYKDASLVMIPSAYKDGKLYSIRPTDGSGDFTFSRGSNLAATRVDVNGLIEKGRENVLLQSNQLDTTWLIGGGGSGLTLTGNQADRNGGNTAWLIDEVTNDQAIYQVVSINGVQTFSIYAKAGTNDWMRLGLGGGAFSDAYFDLVNGTLGNTLNSIDSAIESAGNGWWRCSVSVNKSVNAVYVYPSEANNSGGTNGSIYIQDAQLEQGLVATDYIETGTSAAQSGILEDMPRLDYSGGASCPSLLLEPQRTNLIVNSEYSVNSWGGVRRVSPTANAGISPEGLSNATKVDETAVSGTHMFDYNFTATSGVTYTFSYFAKAAERNECYLFGYTDGGVFSSQRAIFDLSDGTIVSNVGNGIADIQPYNDGWYRVSLTLTAQASSSAGYWGIGLSLDSATSYLGVASNGIYMYGFQHEVGSYPTSYIPTYGTSQTRSADDCKVEDLQSNGIVDTNWTYFFEWGDYVADRNFEMKTSSNFNFIFMVSRLVRYFKQNGSVDTLFSLPTNGTSLKVIISYDGETLKGYMNGSLVGSSADADSLYFTDLDLLRLDRASNDSEEFKQLLLFPTALTDSECIALTTL